MAEKFPVIDIFAGPGGLGEGFSAFKDKNDKHRFKIALSIEKDPIAHKTLMLRSFFRQFLENEVPKDYYSFVRDEISFDKLFELHPNEAKKAQNEAWNTTLGTDKEPHKNVDTRIEGALNGTKNWMLIGGPPCQAYSVVGRSRNGGIDKEDPRIYLYREYYRILAKHKPSVFIMENVKGILSSKLKNEKENLFKQILADLKNPFQGYKKLFGEKIEENDCPQYKIYSLVKESRRDLIEEVTDPKDFIIKCEEYGIPEKRHRVILFGIRSDWQHSGQYLTSNKEQIPIENIIGDLPRLRSGLSKHKDAAAELKKVLLNEFATLKSQTEDSDVLKSMKEIIDNLDDPIEGRGRRFISGTFEPVYNPKEWYSDSDLKGICNHETRGHMDKDLIRYLFMSCLAQIKEKSPKLQDLPDSLLPAHKNVEWALIEGLFNDRFHVQVIGRPATTITSHISKDGHYFIHYDPSQCRALTVREAARIQTFPDNYFFCGERTSQYVQVGNAVPPLLANQIAEIVLSVFEENIANHDGQNNKGETELEHVKDKGQGHKTRINRKITSS